MSADRKQGDPRLGSVDALRGIAILLVIHHHMFGGFTPIGWHAPTVAGHPVPLFAVLANGAYGVNLFFLLSGFVLVLPHVHAQRESLRADEVWRFYRRRARRLLPLYYVSVAVAYLAHAGLSWPTRRALRELALTGTFLFQFSEGHFFPSFNPVLWSLAIEISFSVLLPFLAVTLLRVGAARVVATAVVVAMLTRWYGTATGPSLAIINSAIGRLDDFAVGMAAAAALVRWAPPKRALAWIVGGLGILQLGFMLADSLALSGFTVARAVLPAELVSLGGFVLLRGMLAAEQTGAPVAPALLQLIGRMSYSLYLWHLVARDAMFHSADDLTALWLAAYFILLFSVSALTYRFVEFGHEPDWRGLFRVRRGGSSRRGTDR